MSVLLETRGLGKRYGKNWALQECSLQVRAHRVVGLVGPNGAGKTTLLHLAVGLLAPSTGKVHICGLSPQKSPHLVLPRIGFVAQDHPLYRSFTVKDLFSFGACLNPQWDEQLARTRLARLGIPENRPCGKLSGGQQAQVALAMALAKRPEILLLDEPVANLDPLARREFQHTLMETVAETGQTVLFSSHLVSDLERVCDSLIILSASRVQLSGDVESLMQSHKRLIGPPQRAESITRTQTVLQQSVTQRQCSLLVCLKAPVVDPAWIVQNVTLEEIILAYLALPGQDSPATEAAAARLEVVQ